MQTINTRQSLLKLIHTHLEIAPDSTLEKVLELLEDEEDIRDARTEIADAKIHGTISWDEYKKEIA